MRVNSITAKIELAEINRAKFEEFFKSIRSIVFTKSKGEILMIDGMLAVRLYSSDSLYLAQGAINLLSDFVKEIKNLADHFEKNALS